MRFQLISQPLAQAGGTPLDLMPIDESVYRDSPVPGDLVPALARGEQLASLSLPLPDRPADAPRLGALRITVNDSAGSVVREIAGLAPSASSPEFYPLLLPIADLAPDQYSLRLFEAEGSDEEPLATYLFRVTDR